ncbi:hypothetical protein M011DRAFT_514221 [Sporormia fimetaria CBS 119925]|uniref:Uncharacterized protein n=1 Tax=Sporormia fimetaria CBS 119925 TaxID=1340428 RepID=A0A6A6UU92_9PLEO|nr:hypothetical protein M011DRAFT_514221 [Sporormia fimetaria CBS 119925]
MDRGVEEERQEMDRWRDEERQKLVRWRDKERQRLDRWRDEEREFQRSLMSRLATQEFAAAISGGGMMLGDLSVYTGNPIARQSDQENCNLKVGGVANLGAGPWSPTVQGGYFCGIETEMELAVEEEQYMSGALSAAETFDSIMGAESGF